MASQPGLASGKGHFLTPMKTGVQALRLQVEAQKEDAKIILGEDGAVVVVVQEKLLSHRAEVVLARVLALLHERREVAMDAINVGVG